MKPVVLSSLEDLILKDFVMSCRVAMKHVERAFLYALTNSALFKNYERISIKVVKTDRNNPLREQLLQMPVIIEHEDASELMISLNKSEKFVEENIIKVVFNE